MENLIKIKEGNAGEKNVAIFFRKSDESFIVWYLDKDGDKYGGVYDLTLESALLRYHKRMGEDTIADYLKTINEHKSELEGLIED